MTTAVRTDQDCKLSYALSTNPNPLTASPPVVSGLEDELAYADLDLVISNSGSEAVRCGRIAVVLPIGSLAQDLAVSGESIEAYVSPESAWTIVDVQSDVLLAVPTAETALFRAAGSTASADGRVRFEVTPAAGGSSEVTVDGLYIHLSGIKVSDKTGIARIQIEEWAAVDGEALPETPNSRSLEVAKFPFRSGGSPDPGIGRALAALESTGDAPATRVAAGTRVVLEWNHLRGDSHELYADGERVDSPDVSGASRWQAPANYLKRDTAFALKTVTPTPEGGFVVRWDHVTVCVTDQTLASLAVTGTLGVTGDSTLGAVAAASATVTGDTDLGKLTVTGATVLAGLTAGATSVGTLTASGLITADAGLTVGAAQTLKTMKISPTTANGTITLNGTVASDGDVTLAANKTLRTDFVAASAAADGVTVTSNLTMKSGTVLKAAAMNLFGSSTHFTGSFTAQTDGLVFGFGTDKGVSVSGGMAVPTNMSKNTKDSIIVPVKKGAAVSINRNEGAWYFLSFGNA
jgi:hypothetical protein